MRRSERHGRWPAAVAVLALHGLLFWALRPGAPAPRPPAPQPVTWLRLLAEEPPPAPAPAAPGRPTPKATARAAPPPAPAMPATAVPPPAEPQAITAPATALPPPAPPPPLILALPPAAAGSSPGWREQMLRDPRANSRPARGATEALRALAGDGRRREETLAGEGRRRVRIDGACVEVHEARMAQLDPHNQSTNPLPAQVRSCD